MFFLNNVVLFIVLNSLFDKILLTFNFFPVLRSLLIYLFNFFL